MSQSTAGAEHQKLLWPVHKKVCGPGKANPFMWPNLSQYEADEAKKHLSDDGENSFRANILDRGVPPNCHK
ncbi:hypothetical protein JCM8097_004680 [Rhodosporidiobolus ruineniae]